MKPAWALCRIYRVTLIFATLLCSGCLTATTQHFNSGETLLPGVTHVTLGMASIPVTTCEGKAKRGSDGFVVCPEAKLQTGPLPSYTWSLGVREKWGPFTGVEIGWMAEALGTIDFNAKLGLPGFKEHPAWHHAIMTGWGLGNWADNTLFLEYAISWYAKKRLLLYTNARGSHVATSLKDLELSDLETDDKSNVFKHHQRWLLQNTWGVRIGPFDVPVLPKFYDVNVHMGTPKLMFPGGVPSKDVVKDGYPSMYTAIGMGLTW